MDRKLTVRELKKALENVPDDLEVNFSSDTGVDDTDEVLLHNPRRITYTTSSLVKVDKFVIYGDFKEELEEE